MIEIGRFEPSANDFSGTILTLGLTATLHIIAAEPTQNARAPQWHIHLGTAEGPRIGAGWSASSETSGDIMKLVLDAPELLAPIRARLVPSGGDDATYLLLWARRTGRGAREAQ